RTALFAAAARDKTGELVELFLKYRPGFALANMADCWGSKPVVIAAENSRVKATELLQGLTQVAAPTARPKTIATDFSRGWVFLGPNQGFGAGVLEGLKNVDLQGMSLQRFGDGAMRKTWKEVQRWPVREGDFVIVLTT